jgi:hypothetical protein
MSNIFGLRATQVVNCFFSKSGQYLQILGNPQLQTHIDQYSCKVSLTLDKIDFELYGAQIEISDVRYIHYRILNFCNKMF